VYNDIPVLNNQQEEAEDKYFQAEEEWVT